MVVGEQKICQILKKMPDNRWFKCPTANTVGGMFFFLFNLALNGSNQVGRIDEGGQQRVMMNVVSSLESEKLRTNTLIISNRITPPLN